MRCPTLHFQRDSATLSEHSSGRCKARICGALTLCLVENMGVFHAGQVLVMIEFEKCSDLMGVDKHAFPVYGAIAV
jgi:hypothetical protein